MDGRAFFTLAELAKRWQVSRSTIFNEIKRGRLRRKLIGGQVRFAVEDVLEYERKAG